MNARPEPPDSYWAPDGGAREGRVREIRPPAQRGKFWRCCCPCQATRRGGGLHRKRAGGEESPAQRDFFSDRVVSLSRKNTKIHHISREMEMEMQQPQEGHMGVPWVLFLLHVFFFFSNLFRFGKKWEIVRTTPNIKNYQTQRAE